MIAPIRPDETELSEKESALINRFTGEINSELRFYYPPGKQTRRISIDTVGTWKELDSLESDVVALSVQDRLLPILASRFMKAGWNVVIEGEIEDNTIMLALSPI